MATEGVLHMTTGLGEASYANNSTFQKKVLLEVEPTLEESIKGLLNHTTFKSSNLKVADLGCSSGPNALLVAYNIMNVINKTKLSSNLVEPVLQVYLNDLFGNDFNVIFKLLPNFYQRIQKNGDNVGTCFINATPGNFYGRLFPNNYINFFHSSTSLHWLSQAPEELIKGAKLVNKGQVHITSTTPPEVYKAYFEQFQRNFNLFLSSRADELTPGGSMVLSFLGRKNDLFETGNPIASIGMALKDMVLEGLVEETKLDYFNFPTYFPTVDEVKQIIDAGGSFNLQILKAIQISWNEHLPDDIDVSVLDSKMRGELISKSLRAVFEPILAATFGKNIMDELFSRFGKKISQIMKLGALEYTTLIMSMTKAPEEEKQDMINY